MIVLNKRPDFLFSDQSSDLSMDEFDMAVHYIDRIKSILDLQEQVLSEQKADPKIVLPDNNWSKSKGQAFELDGTITNMYTSFDLIMRKDFDIIKKLRLYAQGFSGYQLATWSPAYCRPWIREKLPENIDFFIKMLVGLPDESVHSYLKFVAKAPKKLLLSPPAKFGEIGWVIDDVIVNMDTVVYLERMCLMHENNVLDAALSSAKGRPVKILEIGGGYGGLAYNLVRQFGNCRYVMVDLPESVLFPAIYLSVLKPDLENSMIDRFEPFTLDESAGFTFVPNFLIDQLHVGDEKFDLVINTLSFSEMSELQIDHYGKLVSSLLSETGIFFEQNQGSKINGTDKTLLESIFSKYFSKMTYGNSKILDSIHAQGQPRIWEL
ncbi:MAG: hypothetical protein C0403_03140 [Desulfobacterium sp.]|nr:hypothetical protein [Desulfobacterium sp.]